MRASGPQAWLLGELIAYFDVDGVGQRTEGSQLRFVFAHGQSGDRRVEGIFGPGGPFEQVSRLLGKVLEQIVVSRDHLP